MIRTKTRRRMRKEQEEEQEQEEKEEEQEEQEKEEQAQEEGQEEKQEDEQEEKQEEEARRVARLWRLLHAALVFHMKNDPVLGIIKANLFVRLLHSKDCTRAAGFCVSSACKLLL